MRTWLCLSLIKRNNRNSSSSQLLASCSFELSESSSIDETTAALSAVAISFSFLNLVRDSADALYNFAPAVVVAPFLWCTVICVILHHKTKSRSSQRNAPIVCVPWKNLHQFKGLGHPVGLPTVFLQFDTERFAAKADHHKAFWSHTVENNAR